MTKTRKTSGKTSSRKHVSDGPPLIVFMTSMGGGVMGYLAGEMAFYTRPHSIHWTVALTGILLGYLTGLIIYRQRGDII